MSDGSALTSWQPSNAQRHVLSVFQSHGYDITVVDACQEAEISRQTYYDWHAKPEFSAWWENEANKHFRLQLASVHVATLRCATGKATVPVNPTACKLFYERFDDSYVPASRTKQEISGSVGLDLAGATTEDLERLAHAIDDTAPDLGLPDEKDGGNPTTGEVGAGPTGST